MPKGHPKHRYNRPLILKLAAATGTTEQTVENNIIYLCKKLDLNNLIDAETPTC